MKYVILQNDTCINEANTLEEANEILELCKKDEPYEKFSIMQKDEYIKHLDDTDKKIIGNHHAFID